MAQSVLQIAAAADLQPVLPRVIDRFERQRGVAATASYSSSSTLATQIINGAPFDVFLSADLFFAQKVIDAGVTSSATPVPYARGTLVLWERKDGPIQPLRVDALSSASVQSIAIANPDHAPYGRAAVASLTKLRLLADVEPKLRVAENIAQAAQFVESGNAQVGLISKTSAMTEKMRSEGVFIEMPGESYPAIEQGAVILKRTGGNELLARQFLDFLLSEPIQQQLHQSGLQSAR